MKTIFKLTNLKLKYRSNHMYMAYNGFYFNIYMEYNTLTASSMFGQR